MWFRQHTSRYCARPILHVRACRDSLFANIVFLLSYVQVCERHFKPEHLRVISMYTDGDGRTVEVPMKLIRITSDAVPAIFPDCPSYLSSTKQSREEPDVKRRRSESAQLNTAIQQSTAAYEKNQTTNCKS